MSKVLVIEDDPFVRRFYERLFKFKNYDIDIAASGEEGLKKVKLQKPSLVLLDIMMPGMNGLEVLKLIKADPETKDCEVVMLTNLQDTQSAKQAAELGASAFIVKAQVTDDELLQVVDSFIWPKS